MGAIISGIVTLVSLVAGWMMFKKMGRQGWESIIPFYSAYVEFKMLYGNGWKFLTILIPFYGIYVAIKFNIDLAKAFGYPAIFGVGLLFVSPVFLMILGFGNNKFLDGTYANNEPDFVSNVVDATSHVVEEKAHGSEDNYRAGDNEFPDTKL